MSSTEELQKQIENVLKQKELIEAQKALEEARKSANTQLEQLQKTSDIVAKQKTIAEDQKTIAQAQRDAILASFPQGTTKALEGDITASEKFGYIARLVSYETMKKNAVEVAKTITDLLRKRDRTGNKSNVLIVNDLDIASSDISLEQIESVNALFTNSMNNQKDTNNKFLKENKPVGAKALPLAAAVLAPMIIPGIISSVADIVGYFQTNYDIKGQEFTLDNQAFVSIVAGNMGVPVYIYNFHLVKDSEVISNFKTALAVKLELDNTIDQIRIEVVKRKADEIKTMRDKVEELKKRLGELKDTPQDKKEKEEIQRKLVSYDRSVARSNEVIDRANVHIANSESLSKAFLVFSDSATKAADANTLPLLLKAALRKHIRKLDIQYLLNLKIASSGGEAITMKHRFLFWMTNSSFIGGSVISYTLAEIDGKIVAADTLPGLARLNYQLSGLGIHDFREISLPTYSPKLG